MAFGRSSKIQLESESSQMTTARADIKAFWGRGGGRAAGMPAQWEAAVKSVAACSEDERQQLLLELPGTRAGTTGAKLARLETLLRAAS